jgi:Fe-S-cluster containining protein
MNDQPWYRGGLRFQCAGCGACCCGEPGYVWVNKAEIEAMAAALKISAEQFQKKYVRLVGIRKSLTERAGGDCILYERPTQRCRVYEVRPRQCHTWPFWASNLRSPETWEAVCRQCPGVGHGPLFPLRSIRAEADLLRV